MPMVDLDSPFIATLLAIEGVALVLVTSLAVVLLKRLRQARRKNPTHEAPAAEPVVAAEKLRKWPGGPARIDPKSIAANRESPTAPKLIVVPRLEDATDASVPRINVQAELARRHAPIWERAERGESAPEIARAVGRPLGEVEVVLRLRRRLLARGARTGAEEHA